MIFLELKVEDYWEIQAVLEKARRNDLVKKLVKARDQEVEETYEVQVDGEGFFSLK